MVPLFISTLLGLRSIRMQWPAPYKLFSVLLICVSATEIFAVLWKYLPSIINGWRFSSSNLWIYNLFLIPQYLLYFTVYHKLLQSTVMKRVIRIFCFVYVGFALFNMLYIQSIYSVESLTLILADSFVVFLTTVYFEQLRKQKEIIALTSEPMVWISLGAFIFHTVSLPYMIGLNFLNKVDISLAIALFYIYMLLNFLMYSLYSIAFLCRRTPPKQLVL